MINQFLSHTVFLAILLALLSAGLTGLTLIALRRRAILDLPNERSSHTVPTPRGGGWGLMLALIPAWVWAAWQAGRLQTAPETLLLVGTVLLMAVSWIDDRRGLGPAVRFSVQFVAAASVMMALPRDLVLFGGVLPLPLDRLIATIAWLWFVNLFNFMDGIDGIAGGSAFAMGFGLMLVWLRHGPDQLEAFRSAMIAACCIGFLAWNWQPAKIFMGDVGSVSLGYLLGYELIRLAMDGGQVFAAILALYYLADATITLLRRGLRGEKVWRAHREHFYQRSTQLGRSHGRTAGTAITVQLALALLGWGATIFGGWLLLPAAGLVGLLLRWMSRPPRLRLG